MRSFGSHTCSYLAKMARFRLSSAIFRSSERDKSCSSHSNHAQIAAALRLRYDRDFSNRDHTTVIASYCSCTLSALIPPALIPPHLANVAGLRAGGRKGRRKKGRQKKGQGTKKISPASMLHFSVEFRLFLTN